MLKQLALAVALVLGALLLLDGALVGVVPLERAAEPSDIRSLGVLQSKLDALGAAPDMAVALLGDSVVYGRALEERGDAEWRTNDLAARLREALEERTGRAVRVVNFAMNGALPVDQERLLDRILPLGPDLVVLDVSLRSFSSDFRRTESQASRPWLADLEPRGVAGVEAALGSAAASRWALYRHRDWLQNRLFDGQPRGAVIALRGRLNDRLLGRDGGPSEDDALEAEMALLLKVKARYAAIEEAPDHPQRLALDRLVGALRDSETAAVLFYATESPALLPQLVDMAAHADRLAHLDAAVRGSLGEEQRWLPPQSALHAGHFLDHVHLTREGLALVAGAVADAAPLPGG